MFISIVGTLVSSSPDHFVFDWFGGSRLRVARSRAEGDWEDLKIGDWFEATLSRKRNGEVARALLVGKTEEPKAYADEKLASIYTQIPAARLRPVE